MVTTEKKVLNETQLRVLFKCLFEESPISIWEEDFSAVYNYLTYLRKQGVTDFKEYFSKNLDEVEKCSKLVKILNINKESIKMYNATSKEALLKDLDSIFTEDSKRTFADQLVLIANGATHYGGECINKTVDGKLLDVYLTWTVAEEHQKDYSFVFVSLINITDMKNAERALEESEVKFRTISNSANDAIVMIDNSGNINFWNSAAEKIFGRESSEVIGMQLHSVLTPERYWNIFRKGFENFKITGEGNIIGRTIELNALHKNGEEFPIELSVTGIKLKGEWNGLSVIRDITERKKAEKENRNQREQIKLINKILRHDISNNLASINSTINKFKTERDDKILDNVITNIEKSADLIMKMKEHEFLISTTNLNIYDIGKNFEKILENYQNIEYSIKGSCKVFADDSLNSVIDNLVRNSVIHGGTDRIDIKITSSGSTCEVRVIDYGKGVPEDIKTKIFDEGFKFGSTGGSGLGLHIVKKSVKNWNGDIFIEDTKPHGTTFRLYLRKVN